MDYITYWKQKGEYGEIRISRMLLRKEKRRKKGSKTRTCERCGKVVDYYLGKSENPYYKEMHNIVVMERLCDDCYESASGDI